jgi:hypothetical protein
MKFGDLLNKAKELVADKTKLAQVVEQATDLVDEKTGHKFSNELDRLEAMVTNLQPSDLDRLDGLAQQLDSLDPEEIERLKEIVEQFRGSDSLSDDDVKKLKELARKLDAT